MKRAAILIMLLAVLSPFILLFINFKLLAFCDEFYKREFVKYNVYQQFPQEDIDEINGDVMEYLTNKDINFIGNNFFNEREAAHLADVKQLISFAGYLFNISLAMSIILLAILFSHLKKFDNIVNALGKLSIYCGLLTIGILIILFLAFYFDFDASFTRFHKVFFEDGSWVFYGGDRITALYTEDFFYDSAARIGIGALITSALLLMAGGAITKYLNN